MAFALLKFTLKELNMPALYYKLAWAFCITDYSICPALIVLALNYEAFMVIAKPEHYHY